MWIAGTKGMLRGMSEAVVGYVKMQNKDYADAEKHFLVAIEPHIGQHHFGNVGRRAAEVDGRF